MTIVNDDSRVVNKLETSLTEDARVVICEHHRPQDAATFSRTTFYIMTISKTVFKLNVGLLSVVIYNVIVNISIL